MWVLIKNSWIRDAKIGGYQIGVFAYRVLEITVTLVFFQIIFSNIESLAGWTYYEILFLYAFSKIVIDLGSTLFKVGVRSISENLVRTGELDFFLLRPVNTMFLISFSKPRVLDSINCIFSVAIGYYALIAGNIAIKSENIIWFLFLALFGVVIYYFLSVLVITPAFWVVKLWSIKYVMNRLGQLMQYPAGILPGAIRMIFFTAFPILAVSYIPVRVLFWGPKLEYVVYMIVITLILGIVTRAIWKLGERSYASASS